jgi:hypothetical protein
MGSRKHVFEAVCWKLLLGKKNLPTAIPLCWAFHTASKSEPVPGQFGARASVLVSHRQRTGSGL